MVPATGVWPDAERAASALDFKLWRFQPNFDFQHERWSPMRRAFEGMTAFDSRQGVVLGGRKGGGRSRPRWGTLTAGLGAHRVWGTFAIC